MEGEVGGAKREVVQVKKILENAADLYEVLRVEYGGFY